MNTEELRKLLEAATPGPWRFNEHHTLHRAVLVTHGHLRGACANQVAIFRKIFPDGATWPDDIDQAHNAGLDVMWPVQNLGFLPPLSDAASLEETDDE
jgi:hypothetical protein